MRSEKHVVRRFYCADISVHIQGPLHTWASRYGLAPPVYMPARHVTVLDAVGSCNGPRHVMGVTGILGGVIIPRDHLTALLCST